MSEFNALPISDEEMDALVGGTTLTDAPGTVENSSTPTPPEKKETKTETTVSPQSTPKTFDELEIEDLVEDEPVVENSESDPKDIDPSKEEPSINRNEYYKLLVAKGEWFPLVDDKGEEIKDITLNDEEFQELAIKQANWKAEEILKQREEEFGDQYSTFVEFMKNGGKVEDLARFEAEQKDVDSYDPTDPDDAEELIKAYKTSKGESEKSIKKYLEFLKDQGIDDLKEVAEESKNALLKDIQTEKAALIEAQKRQAEYDRESQEIYIKGLKKAIHQDSIPEREKKEIEKFYFDLKNITKDGKKVSDFHLKIQEIQGDPNKFNKLIQVIKDFDDYEKKSVTKKEAQKEAFKLFRGGPSSQSNQSPEEIKQSKTIQKPTTFDQFRKK